MPITEDELGGFELLLDGLGGYRNRNSRVIGQQFNEPPDRTTNPDYYETGKAPRSLNMVRDALLEGEYSDASQVYADIVATFRAVRDTINKSSVTWRDAVKMESVLEDVWTSRTLPEITENRLPMLDSLDPSVRHPRKEASADLDGTEFEGRKRGSARPSMTPRVSADSVHRATAPPTPASRIMASSTSTPVTVAPNKSLAAMQTATPSTPVHVLASFANKQPSNSSLHNAVPMPLPSGEQGIEIPVYLPPSIVSKEAKMKLQEQQHDILVRRARRLAPKKRKREADEVSDDQSGWLEPKRDGIEQKQFFSDVLAHLRSARDPETSRPLSASINALPGRDKFPQFYQYIKDPQPPTLNSVEKHIRTNRAPDSSDFDAEMVTIFSNARLWQTAGLSSSDGEGLPGFYGDVLGAQRIYQEMSRGNGYVPQEALSPAAAASVQHGPGQIPLELQEDDEGDQRYLVKMPNNRIPSSEKTYLDSIQFKGEKLEAGDCVHLYNPSNPRLPIVGQIFGCYQQNNTQDRYMTVNWYYRPSQTNHTAERTFLEQEVFKTSLFIDHKVADFLERISIMPVNDYARGRYEYWNEEMPTYVVEHRWKIETNQFVKIKNWNLCVPEGTAPQPSAFRPFLDAAAVPQRIKSPFIRKIVVSGPGKLAGPLMAESEEQSAYYAALDSWPPGTGQVYGYAKLMLQKRVAPPRELFEEGEVEDGTSKRRRDSSTQAGDPSQPSGANSQFFSRDTFEPTTQAENLAIQEVFETLPSDLQTKFRLDPNTKDLLWFAAPPLEPAAESKSVAPSLGYLAFMAEKLGY